MRTGSRYTAVSQAALLGKPLDYIGSQEKIAAKDSVPMAAQYGLARSVPASSIVARAAVVSGPRQTRAGSSREVAVVAENPITFCILRMPCRKQAPRDIFH